MLDQQELVSHRELNYFVVIMLLLVGVKSTTKGAKLWKESDSRYWLDSQGANDSGGADDEKVLTDVLKNLYDNQVTNIKVVWCFSDDLCREKQEFITQSKFIKLLGNNVWNSCLIILKKGPIKPDNMDGVIAAARSQGSNIRYGDKRLFGYTGLDFMSEKDKSTDRLLKIILKNESSQQKKRRFIRKWIFNQYSNY